MRKQINTGHSSKSGATVVEIYWERLKRTLGNILNYFHIPGFVKPFKTVDKLTAIHIEVRLSGFFTVISINGRDYYFRRLSGKFDGSGFGCGCGITPPVDYIRD